MTAEENIKKFLLENPGWHASAALCRMEVKNDNGTTAAPKSLSRRLQELAEAGEIAVDYRNGNAYYSTKGTEKPKPAPIFVIINGTRVPVSEL